MRHTVLRLILAVGLASALGCEASGDPPRKRAPGRKTEKKAVDIEPSDSEPADAAAGDDAIKWAVVVGVDRYLDRTIDSLRCAVADAELVAQTLVKKCGYPKDNVLLMTDSQRDFLQPGRINMVQEIPEWLAKAGPNDTVLIFFSGHGFVDDAGQAYLAPRDCQRKNLALYALRTNEVTNWLRRCKAGRKMLILDCCHAGGKGIEPVGSSSEEIGRAFQKAKGLITLASCGNKQKSHEWHEKGHGVFTYFLAEGLCGAADKDNDGIVDSDELYKYVWRKVPDQARNMTVRQTPVRNIGPDVVGVFELARLERIVPPPGPSSTTPNKLTLSFMVRAKSLTGKPLPDATVTVLYRGGPGRPEATIGRGTSDSSGTCELTLSGFWSATQGDFVALVRKGDCSKRFPISSFHTRRSWNLYCPTELAKDFTNSIGMKFKLIPAGEFMMGSPKDEEKRSDDEGPAQKRSDDEGPVHRVRITKPYYLGVYEVTMGQFGEFVEDAGYKTEAEKDGKGGHGIDPSTGKWKQEPEYIWRNPSFKQDADHPVVHVSWNDAVAFCKWLSRKEGKQYRLPTEAEWEYACRAGTTTRYYNGNASEDLAEVGNVGDGTAKKKFPDWKYTISAEDGFVFTAPVGRFRANAFGLYDMHGNVWEWCADWYDSGYYDDSPTVDPTGPTSGSNRVDRGGSWNDYAGNCRSAYRSGFTPGSRAGILGFRLALVPAE